MDLRSKAILSTTISVWALEEPSRLRLNSPIRIEVSYVYFIEVLTEEYARGVEGTQEGSEGKPCMFISSINGTESLHPAKQIMVL